MSDVDARPKVFVGSADEARKMVDAIVKNLSGDFEVQRWKEAFPSGDMTLLAFLQAVDASAFGCFILSPADRVIDGISEAELDVDPTPRPAPRDNVLVEIGAFLGRYGRDHTIILEPEDVQLKLPTDSRDSLPFPSITHEPAKPTP